MPPWCFRSHVLVLLGDPYISGRCQLNSGAMMFMWGHRIPFRRTTLRRRERMADNGFLGCATTTYLKALKNGVLRFLRMTHQTNPRLARRTGFFKTREKATMRQFLLGEIAREGGNKFGVTHVWRLFIVWRYAPQRAAGA